MTAPHVRGWGILGKPQSNPLTSGAAPVKCSRSRLLACRERAEGRPLVKCKEARRGRGLRPHLLGLASSGWSHWSTGLLEDRGIDFFSLGNLGGMVLGLSECWQGGSSCHPCHLLAFPGRWHAGSSRVQWRCGHCDLTEQGEGGGLCPVSSLALQLPPWMNPF